MSDLPDDPSDLPIFGGLPQPVGVTPAQRARGSRPAMHALAGAVSTASNPATEAREPLQMPDPLEPIAAEPLEPTEGVHEYGEYEEEAIDWKVVAELRALASDQLTAALEDAAVDRDAERELGRSIIQELLATLAAEQIHDGKESWSIDLQRRMATAVFNALFGLGRLQPYVDDDSVENIIIAGYKSVWLERTDGSLSKVPRVAESDEELLDFLQFVASRSEANARAFSPSSPRLHMRLDGGARLAAAAWTTAYPSVVIRRHRLRKVTLEDLVERRMLTGTQASLLRAAVLAGKSIVVAGPQGAGKTTMVRALCDAIPDHEKIGTFETEFELHLHELPGDQIVHAWESRPGSGEIGADGKQAGEFTLDEALYDSFRFNLSRQIVGEVRGREVWAMIKAMESGTGSISTTHSSDGEAAIRKLVTCAMEAGSHITRDLATSKLAETVDLIVQVHLETTPLGDDEWRRDRWVSEVIHVTPGEDVKGYAVTPVFRPNPAGGPGVPGTLPDELRDLERYGFDMSSWLYESADQPEVR